MTADRPAHPCKLPLPSGLGGGLRMGMIAILWAVTALPALAANTITLPGGAAAPNAGAAQTVLANDVVNAQGAGAIQGGTFAGLTFQGNWFVAPTDLSLQNGNQLDQWTLLSSNNGNLFNLTSLDLKWRGGQSDTVQGWLNFYLNGVLVDTGSNDKLYDNPNESLAFVMPASQTEIRHVTPISSGYYDRVDVVFNHSITPNSLGIASFALRSSSPTVPFGLASNTVPNPLAQPALTVPEPGTHVLLLTGLAALGLMTRRRQTGLGSRAG